MTDLTRRIRVVGHIALLGIVLTGCQPDETGGGAEAVTEGPYSAELDPGGGMATDFAPELNVDLAAMESTASGLRRRDLALGDGQFATSGDRVAVHYIGWLPDGQQFDSSRGGGPFEFELGAQEVIAGWDEGVAGMREGGRRQLVIPPGLAYGESGPGGMIPPNATLVFEVELLEVR